MKRDGESRGRSLERADVRLARPRCKTLPTPRMKTCERCGSPVRNWRKCPVCNWQPLDPICLKLHLDTDVYQCQAVLLRGIFTNWRGAMKRDEEIRGRSLRDLLFGWPGRVVRHCSRRVVRHASVVVRLFLIRMSISVRRHCCAGSSRIGVTRG